MSKTSERAFILFFSVKRFFLLSRHSAPFLAFFLLFDCARGKS